MTRCRACYYKMEGGPQGGRPASLGIHLLSGAHLRTSPRVLRLPSPLAPARGWNGCVRPLITPPPPKGNSGRSRGRTPGRRPSCPRGVLLVWLRMRHICGRGEESPLAVNHACPHLRRWSLEQAVGSHGCPPLAMGGHDRPSCATHQPQSNHRATTDQPMTGHDAGHVPATSTEARWCFCRQVALQAGLHTVLSATPTP